MSDRAGAVRLVAEREVRERGRSRAFRVTTAVSMVAVVAVVVLPRLFAGDPGPVRVAAERSLPVPVVAYLERLVTVDAGVELVPADAGDVRSLVLDGQVDVGVPSVEAVVVADDADEETMAVAGAVAEGLRVHRALAARGVADRDIDAVLRAPPPRLERLATSPVEDSQRAAAFVAVLAVFFLLQQYGLWILNGVVEEKASRVVEVVLSAVRPAQLLAGKVLGIGVLACAQAALLAVTALVALALAGGSAGGGLSLRVVGGAVAWFILGFAFYATLFAALGSLVSRQEDVQGVQMPVQLPLVVGYVFGASASLGEPSTITRVVAVVPATAPTVMPALIATGQASGALIVASAVVSVAVTAVVLRLAAVVYERAVLRTGRRVRLRQVLVPDR